MKKILISFCTLCIATISGFAQQNVPQWLKTAAIYHIYPSSFMDSDGSGIGDLKGIESKLDYIKSIGMNTVWISPVFSSEFEDGGYDITDFYLVDPRFGTNSDLINLVNAAHAKGMKVCLDLVAGHTSDKHPWFVQSKQSDTNMQYSDYFIWTDSKKDKPKKFVSSDGERQGYFMKNFFDIQPALNYGYADPNPNNPWEQPVTAPGPQAVRRELKNIIAFWMDKGVDGFRVDMAQSLIKNDKDKKVNTQLWKETTDWFGKKYPQGILLSEWSNPTQSLNGGFQIDLQIHNGQGGKTYRPLFCNTTDKGDAVDCYFDKAGKGDIRQAIEVYTREYMANRDKGYACMPTSSHDIWRLNRNQRKDPQELKVALTWFLTLPAPPIVYYGEEIGMRNQEDAPAKEGSFSSRNRSSCRTPMQWDQSQNAGFSTADPGNIYLPIDKNKNFPNVAQQETDPNSVLNYVKSLLKLRNEIPALSTAGEWKYIGDPGKPYPMVYQRSFENKKYIVVLNPSGKKANALISEKGPMKQVFGTSDPGKSKTVKNGTELKMNPVSAAIFEVL